MLKTFLNDAFLHKIKRLLKYSKKTKKIHDKFVKKFLKNIDKQLTTMLKYNRINIS
jgi:hypothetical protein